MKSSGKTLHNSLWLELFAPSYFLTKKKNIAQFMNTIYKWDPLFKLDNFQLSLFQLLSRRCCLLFWTGQLITGYTADLEITNNNKQQTQKNEVRRMPVVDCKLAFFTSYWGFFRINHQKFHYLHGWAP